MNIEVSIGEAIDKFNILEIKYRKITDINKLNEIEKEINSLSLCKSLKDNYYYYYNILTYVNETIWNLTDYIKSIDINNPEYSGISFNIFEYNQKRFRLKNFFNLLINSNIKEQKSYNATYCKIIIDNEEDFYNKIAEINYFTIEYDYVFINTNYNVRYPIQNICKSPNIIYNDEGVNFNLNINIKDINLDYNIKKIFEYPCINYICCGKLGDFIQSISVINELFHNHGRKGNLYISEGIFNNEKLETFRFGIEHTYLDTVDVISSQKYINSYKIYNNEHIDINLNLWRKTNILNKTNWYNIYNQCYNVNWGYSKWISVKNDSKWKDTIFINMTSYRFSNNIDFNLLYSIYGKSLVFISPTEDNYNYFKEKTGLNIDLYSPKTFTDLCIAISSCKLLIGGLSAILSIGHSLHIPRIITNATTDCYIDTNSDNIRNSDLNKLWDNIYYNIDEYIGQCIS